MINDILNAYRAGWSMEAIAKKLGKSPRTIKSLLLEYGITLRTRSQCKKLSLKGKRCVN